MKYQFEFRSSASKCNLELIRGIQAEPFSPRLTAFQMQLRPPFFSLVLKFSVVPLHYVEGVFLQSAPILLQISKYPSTNKARRFQLT